MPEKSIDDLSPDWRAHYETGVAAVARQDWDDALRIFNDILVQEPGFYACRESLRAAQFKKTETSNFFKRAFERFRMRPLLAEAEVCVHASPLKAIHAAERVLNHDPHNFLAHTVLAKAALAADLPHTALLSLEVLHQHSPGDRTVALMLAETLARVGQMARASPIFAWLLRNHPDDPEVHRALEQLHPHPALSDQNQLSRCNGANCQLDECRRRVERYPTDLEARFDLGQCYFETGLISEAISEFQQAEAFPARRIQSLIYLGQCLARRGMYDIAVEKLQQALNGDSASGAEKKELVYGLGCVLEAAGRREETLARFKQLHQADAAYKDVATKVEVSCDTPQPRA